MAFIASFILAFLIVCGSFVDFKDTGSFRSSAWAIMINKEAWGFLGAFTLGIFVVSKLMKTWGTTLLVLIAGLVVLHYMTEMGIV